MVLPGTEPSPLQRGAAAGSARRRPSLLHLFPQAGGAAAGGAVALEAVREKDSKINELIEELGNKELLLSEAQKQLESVSTLVFAAWFLTNAAWFVGTNVILSSPTHAPLLLLLLSSPQTKDARKELVELREMKEDVERREKAQAEVISQQVRRTH